MLISFKWCKSKFLCDKFCAFSFSFLFMEEGIHNRACVLEYLLTIFDKHVLLPLFESAHSCIILNTTTDILHINYANLAPTATDQQSRHSRHVSQSAHFGRYRLFSQSKFNLSRRDQSRECSARVPET